MPAATDKYRQLIEKMFALADIRIDGPRPFDVRVNNPAFYRRIIRDGQLGLGEAYMDGWWDCDALDEMTSRFIQANLHKETVKSFKALLYFLEVRLSGLGKASKAFEVGEAHYDLGNDLFRIMLDPLMVYSCAYWNNAATLEEAQIAKLDLICRKIALKPGMKVLEIGCGWGGWAKYSAEKYGVEVVGLTVSKEQAALARERCAGLPVEIQLQDYRDAQGKYDRIVSIAMFEAVGHKYYRTFMEVAERCLKDDGLFFLHSIVGNEPVGAAEAPWLNKYIFPNGELPSLAQIMTAAEGLFVVEGAHHFANDYDRTLAAWQENFRRNWPQISDKYDQRFYRMWELYLAMARGIFQARIAHIWHIVFSKNGLARNRRPEMDAMFAAHDAR
ncbi:MAG: cyclopropane fatty acyl phospholipid synthase [Bryobacteraceae bacterium]|nr:cyclopropane fatty acyl phospholipid synthase [Bryobacteraceae bacterium]